MMKTDEEFGLWVRTERRRLGWTQARLAEAVTAGGFPMSQVTLGKVETAARARGVTLREAGAIEAALWAEAVQGAQRSDDEAGELETWLVRRGDPRPEKKREPDHVQEWMVRYFQNPPEPPAPQYLLDEIEVEAAVAEQNLQDPEHGVTGRDRLRDEQRRRHIVELHRRRWTLGAIARLYGVSTERTRQIVTRMEGAQHDAR